MVLLIDSINAIRDFLDTGGQVLLVIAVLIFAMWLLILERFMYFLMAIDTTKKTLKIRGKRAVNATAGTQSKYARPWCHAPVCD